MIMTTNELLFKLPRMIGNCGKGCYLKRYDHPEDQIGFLTLVNEGGNPPWRASYDDDGQFVCMNPLNKEPPYNNAVAWGNTPNEALQGLYDWCINNGFITE